ncbi:hypothetical protein DESUT3_20760 [Desulfuromonas versatilis]|uniref:Uncharacterized protein n=1 Tax=Desulfuromonas versatilis TaxID=2802975 RepID=A0ABM8HW72_9BACT|nr:hypothetical protein [Desulfuromonas versatilis]BCR05007.1 hypothetical protein DESUT3_20760 [Desulfuromonas versatilis]
MKKISRLLFFLILLFSSPPCLADNPGTLPDAPQSSAQRESAALVARTGRIHFSYEQLDMPKAGENMGLLGFAYLFDIYHGLYGGIGGYGAVDGERGGFFTGGLEGGYRLDLIGPLQADVGLFVGGGGGGAAPQGGGLMLRPHVGLGLDLEKLRLGLDYSRVKFPNGEIDSDQVAVSLDFPFATLHGATRQRGRVVSAGDLGLGGSAKPFGFAEESLVLTGRSYFPSGSSRTTSGRKLDDRIDLVGFEYRRYISRHGYLLAEFGGALGGSADGYAEVLFGAGHRFSLEEERGPEAALSLAVGGAGGGAVDTGGGAVGRAGLSLGWRFTPSFAAGLEGGYFSALDGDFDAATVALKVSYNLDSAVPGGGVRRGEETDSLELVGWQVRASHQSYLSPQRKSGVDDSDDVHLVGVKADLMLARYLYLSGQAAGGYDGDAGGYAVGLVGLGLQSEPSSILGLRLHGEILAGAAGGGGIDVGDGAIVQPMLGLSRDLGDNLGLVAQVGRVMALSGDLDATILDVGLLYRFATPVLAR